jgi:hypothetical protein
MQEGGKDSQISPAAMYSSGCPIILDPFTLRIDSSFEIAPMKGAVGRVGVQGFSQNEYRYTKQSESKKDIVNVFVSSFLKGLDHEMNMTNKHLKLNNLCWRAKVRKRLPRSINTYGRTCRARSPRLPRSRFCIRPSHSDCPSAGLAR